MAYGEGYRPREYNQFVPEGDYLVQLGQPEDIERGGYRIRKIPIKIKGYPGYSPESWDIFDAPRDDAEKLENWNKQRTRDADAFKVQRGDFRPESWRGKIGRVHIAKDSKGYMQVKWSIVEDASAPVPIAQAPKPAPKPAVDDWGEPARTVPATDDFTDDIPF